MIILLSPAKNLNFDPAPKGIASSRPRLKSDTKELAEITRGLKNRDLKKLMGISDKLADLNVERFQSFKDSGKAPGEKQAVLAFNGDVYWGLEAKTLSPEDLNWAQDHLRILSGFYGLLRPLDVIQPYRLEMGTKLKTARGKGLYTFWGDKLARAINKDVKGQSQEVILNLASNEYFGAVDSDMLNAPVITPSFLDEKEGKVRPLFFYVKRARGAMARWVIENRITKVEDLKNFTIGNYKFNQEMSDGSKWVFTRPQPAKKAA